MHINHIQIRPIYSSIYRIFLFHYVTITNMDNESTIIYNPGCSIDSDT